MDQAYTRRDVLRLGAIAAGVAAGAAVFGGIEAIVGGGAEAQEQGARIDAGWKPGFAVGRYEVNQKAAGRIREIARVLRGDAVYFREIATANEQGREYAVPGADLKLSDKKDRGYLLQACKQADKDGNLRVDLKEAQAAYLDTMRNLSKDRLRPWGEMPQAQQGKEPSLDDM